MTCTTFALFALGFEININPTFTITISRKSLSMRHKNLILKEHKCDLEFGATLSQAALVLWAKQNLKLGHLNDQSTVSRILRDEDKIKKVAAGHNPNTNSTRQSTAPHIEYTLFSMDMQTKQPWCDAQCRACRHKRLAVTG